jgi:hypothetical protein
MASVALGAAGREYHFEDSMFTFPISGTVTSADVGKAVMLDTGVTPAAGAAPTVKLTTDGAEIFGRIEQIELRTQEGTQYATVALRFIGNLPMKSGETPAVGAQLIGYTGGLAKTRTASTVVDTGTSGATITIAPGASKSCFVYNYDATNNVVNCAFGV